VTDKVIDNHRVR